MNTYAKLAKDVTEHYVRRHAVLPLPSVLPAELRRQRACYVYLYENPGHRLRAFFGAPLPYEPSVAGEIVRHTITALTRFPSPSVRRADLSFLVYTVALLEPLQRVSSVAQLDPTRFGLYVRSDRGHSTVLLPGRTGVGTAQDQVATALRELGADPRYCAIAMYRFGVTYHE